MILLNGEPVNVTLFPDNTSQVWKLDEKHLNHEYVTVEWHYSHEGEIMQLAQLKQLLDRTVDAVYLYISYLPYGRQDKEVSNDATFALRTFAAILNSLSFTRVTILDPHSKIALGLINNSSAIFPIMELKQVIGASHADLICYPDKGAVEKYTEVYFLNTNYIYGSKVRDQATGRILDYEVVGGSVAGKNILIVDDICDGGATFVLLAEKLRDYGAKCVTLFVTHGLFSKGLRPLKKAGISGIYTAKGQVITMADGGVGYRAP